MSNKIMTDNLRQQGYLTAKQWAKKGLFPKANAEGIVRWSNPYYNNLFRYYAPDEVEENVELLEKYRVKCRAKDKEQRVKAKAKAKEQQSELLQELDELRTRVYSLSYTNSIKVDAISRLLKELKATRTASGSERVRTIVIDTETTGLDSTYNEILQLSIIDADTEEILYNQYFKPLYSVSWEDAEAIHHISPQMVENKPYLLDCIEELQAIFDTVKCIIGYNTSFDVDFVSKYIRLNKQVEYIDVMVDFAKIYGEWNDYFEDYKWQKLTKCAEYYGYEWEGDAHNSLEDAKATLYCYKKMLDQENQENHNEN